MSSHKTLTRRDVLTLGMGAGLSSAWLCGPLLGSARGDETAVKASYFGISALIRYYAAKEQGVFRAEGMKLGESFVPGHLVMQSVVSGQVDFTMTNTLDIAKINLQGVRIKILYPAATIDKEHPHAQLVVPAGPAIKAAKDLEGARSPWRRCGVGPR